MCEQMCVYMHVLYVVTEREFDVCKYEYESVCMYVSSCVSVSVSEPYQWQAVGV